MMNLINGEDGYGVKRFGVGHFDLVIIDDIIITTYYTKSSTKRCVLVAEIKQYKAD
jgi:type I site-specific restriction endonuclease